MSPRVEQLCFHEELLLLALRDAKGTVHGQAGFYQYALAAGVLAELLLQKRIAIVDARKRMVEVVDDTPTGNELLDECLERIYTAKRRQRLQTWVQRIGNRSKLKHDVARALCRKGALREDEDRVLLLFRRRLYPEQDPRFEQRIIERLRKAIFSDSGKVDPRTAVLVSLAHGTDLLAIPFKRKELRERKQRIKQITDGEVLGKVAKEAAEAVQAAIIAATTAASVSATVVATTGSS